MVQGLPVLSHTLGRKVREGLKDVGQFLTRWFARPCVQGDCSYVAFLSVPCCNANLSIPWTYHYVSSYGLAAYPTGTYYSGVPYLGAFLGLELGFKRPDPLYRSKVTNVRLRWLWPSEYFRNWPQFNLGWLLTGQGPVRLEVGPASGKGGAPLRRRQSARKESSARRRRPSRLSVGGN